MSRLSGFFRRACYLCILLALSVVVPAAPILAQGASAVQSARGAIAGRVVDARSDQPLAGSVVTLELVVGPVAPGGGSAVAVVPPKRTVLANGGGEYVFDELAPGVYRIEVRRLGYVPSSVEVDLRALSRSRLSIGLEVQPIALEPVSVLGDASQPYVRVGSPQAQRSGSRQVVERARQRDYVAGDVRELTAGDVAEAVTLGETDLFRTLQRMPGVSTRDDYTAVLWTRGAHWAQTRVYFDNLPLFNPTHSGWLFSAINPEGVGSAAFHPGVRSVVWPEGAAAVVDLQSREGGKSGWLGGSGELSFATLRLALDGELPGGKGGWMIAARRTHVDWLTRAMEVIQVEDSAYVPYNFSDLIARVDVPLGRGWRIEASGITEVDRLRGDVTLAVTGNTARWGNDAGRVTLQVPIGRLTTRVTMGATRAATRVCERVEADTLLPTLICDPLVVSELPPTYATLPALNTMVRHRFIGAEIEPVSTPGRPTRWSAGVQFLWDSVNYEGPYSFTAERFKAFSATKSRFHLGRELQRVAVWTERRLTAGDKIDVEAGLRYEKGDPVREALDTATSSARLAPRISVRYRPDAATNISGGVARSFQFTQDVGAQAGPLGPQLHLSHLWLVADVGRPAIRADIATLGVERWAGDGWLLSANSYLRHSAGITHPDTATGRLDPDQARVFVPAENTAYGLELSARRLIGRWSTSLAYTLAKSDIQVGTLRFPSSADIRHALDATGSVHLTNSVRLSGAYSFTSGFPFTRIMIPDSGVPVLQAPNGGRSPAYASLDLSLEYGKRWGTWEFSAYAQLRNALGRGNAVTYSGSYERLCAPDTGVCPERGAVDDEFSPGLPRLPLLGVRVAF